VGVEVFEPGTVDPKTSAKQIEKIQKRFGLRRVVLMGDRGMLTEARIDRELRPNGLDWITALRAPAIRALAEAGAVQLSPFDGQDLAEITLPLYPGERPVACRNPLPADVRARKRAEMLKATEKELDKIVAATRRARTVCGAGTGSRGGWGRGGTASGWPGISGWRAWDDSFRYERDTAGIEAEAALDGTCIIRTSAPADTRNAERTGRAYKGRPSPSGPFAVSRRPTGRRPIHHRPADRVRAHVRLCMLAYYVEWHRRRASAPIPVDEDDKRRRAASGVGGREGSAVRAGRSAGRHEADGGRAAACTASAPCRPTWAR